MGEFMPAARQFPFSRTIREGVLLSSAWIALGSTVLAAPASAAADAPTNGNGDAESALANDPIGSEGDLIVTARFKAENLSKVPVAITVLDGLHLEEAHLQTLDQFQRLAPSLQIQGVNPRNQTVAIRGLGANPGLTTEGFEAGVGIYLDGVYNSRSAITLFDIFDIERVEVLRGPQGTLFGKNTVGGAVSIISKAPETTFGGAVEGSYGNYDSRQVAATVTGPLADTLAVRLTVGDTRREASIRRYSNGELYYGLHNQTAKGQLLFRPSEAFSLRVIGDYNYQYQNVPTAVLVTALPGTLGNGATVTTFAQRSANAGYTPLPINPEARTSDIDGPFFWRMRIGGISANAELEVGGLRFTSITAYRFYHIRPGYDIDSTGAQLYRNVAVDTDQRQFSQELRVQSSVRDIFDYTAGLYYFRQSMEVDSNIVYGPQAAQFLIGPTYNPAVLDRLIQHQLSNPKTDSYSAFGQATLHITPRLSATVGLRYTYEDKSGSTIGDAGTQVAPIASLPTNQQAVATTFRNRLAPALAYDARWKGGNVSGTAGLSYQATDNILAYATYSRGFKSAGLNLGAASNVPKVVEPEKANSYEIGLKTRLLDRRLTFNATLFQTDVENFQATIFDPTASTSYIANAGSVRSRGAEVDLSARVADGLTVGFAGAFTDAYYNSVKNTTCPFLLSYQTSCNINGLQLAGVSRWAWTATVEYKRPIGRRELYVGGDYAYRSHYFSNLNDDPYSRIAGYGVLGAHIGIRAANDAWDLSLWGKNLTNKFYYTVLNINTQNGIVGGMPGDPRYYGVRLKVGF